MMTSYLVSFAYKSWKLTKIMPNSLKLLNHYILSNAPQKIRQWALKAAIESCVADIPKWMSSNYLKFKDDKLELSIFLSKHAVPPKITSIDVRDESISPAKSCRNIGIRNFKLRQRKDDHTTHNVTKSKYITLHMSNTSLFRGAVTSATPFLVVWSCD